jgi:hypothetical protein
MIITLKQVQEEKIQASKGQIAARDEWQDEILVPLEWKTPQTG